MYEAVLAEIDESEREVSLSRHLARKLDQTLAPELALARPREQDAVACSVYVDDVETIEYILIGSRHRVIQRIQVPAPYVADHGPTRVTGPGAPRAGTRS